MSTSQHIAHSDNVERSQSDATQASVSLIGRVLLSVIFILSGVSKLAAPAMMIGYISSVGLPFPQLALVVAVIVEVGGGLALIAGYRTRVVAAVLALFSVATALAFHHALGDQNQFIHFFKNIAMAGGLLQVVAFGAGRFSLDARRR
ncbi:DoxX family protein [Pseudomonas yamanorum]|uniref:DoxX family protein n=1 Tax=Pseudomonas yamanorum TaxID=515393 RepID=A0A7Y8EGZ2_9PSED|nr:MULTISPECIES: DoxX family protein [Pseudomonas]MCS3418447.1 putative oxidoreductase [Pseudomonas sp. BIGb0558]MCS3438046.1 putative oxidoreductase [Pseudomonas sp. BIGb0450]NVZ83653.1 DoxX family protein [Pseudomonas yamanorum]NWD26724.1 DoxX family protein [Pseudomonas yamanorum]NWE14503.1 DoxX family protein [Pseudomonas yamanorum]